MTTTRAQLIQDAYETATDEHCIHERRADMGQIIDRILPAEPRPTTYNGWTNYATWRVNLEICDDTCSGLIGEMTFPDVDALATYLRETVEELIDAESSGIANDYANAFISDVNWEEIAEANADELVADDSADTDED